MTDPLDLVVHPLQGAVGNADTSPGEDAGEVGAKHPSQVLEGGKGAMARSPEPLAQMGLGPVSLPVVPEPPEILLEEVHRFGDGQVPLGNRP